MNINWEVSENVIEEFKNNNITRCCKTLDAEIMDINPQKIIAINSNFSYPSILNDHKMKILKSSVITNGWIDKLPDILGFCLLMFPNGDLIVDGAGNHRAVLSKELSIPSVKAYVSKVVYCD